MSKDAANEIKLEKGLGYHKITTDDEAEKAINARYSSLSKMKPHDIYDNTLTLPYRRLRLIDSQIVASLPFQILLYFNVWYCFIFIPIFIVSGFYKFGVFEFNNIAICPVLVIIHSIIEIIRVYLGYKGNIEESVNF